MSKNNGFTLIELLIVITIIGILAGVLIMIINPNEYQAQARDARRLNDMISIQTAIVNSIANGGISLLSTSECYDCTSTLGTDAIDGTGWVKFTNLNGRGLIDIIPVLPTDPINNDTYYFSYYSNGTDFELNAVLESDRYQENCQRDGGNDDNVYEKGFNLSLK